MHNLSACPQSHHAPGSGDEERNLVQKSNWKREERMEVQYPPNHSEAEIFQLLPSCLESAFSWVSTALLLPQYPSLMLQSKRSKLFTEFGTAQAGAMPVSHTGSISTRSYKGEPNPAVPHSGTPSSSAGASQFCYFLLILGLSSVRPAKHSRLHTTVRSGIWVYWSGSP